MHDLEFKVIGVEPATRGLTPLLHFKLQISGASSTGAIQALLLSAQIQIQPVKRGYSAIEQNRLLDLFGEPERWGQTLRNRLWTHTNVTVGAFDGATEAILPVPCTYDLNVASSKYFYALEDGEVSLLFLFSGSLFYTNPDGRLQVERISWNKECEYRMHIRIWKDLMEQHYPNSAWMMLQRDVFERLYEYKRRNGLATWEQAIERLLPEEEQKSRAESAILEPQLEEVAK